MPWGKKKKNGRKRTIILNQRKLSKEQAEVVVSEIEREIEEALDTARDEMSDGMDEEGRRAVGSQVARGTVVRALKKRSTKVEDGKDAQLQDALADVGLRTVPQYLDLADSANTAAMERYKLLCGSLKPEDFDYASAEEAFREAQFLLARLENETMQNIGAIVNAIPPDALAAILIADRNFSPEQRTEEHVPGNVFESLLVNNDSGFSAMRASGVNVIARQLHGYRTSLPTGGSTVEEVFNNDTRLSTAQDALIHLVDSTVDAFVGEVSQNVYLDGNVQCELTRARLGELIMSNQLDSEIFGNPDYLSAETAQNIANALEAYHEQQQKAGADRDTLEAIAKEKGAYAQIAQDNQGKHKPPPPQRNNSVHSI